MRKRTNSLFVAVFILLLSMPAWAQEGRRAWNSQSSTDEVVTLKGEITNVLKPYASFKAEDGKEYKVHLGPVWYWKQENLEVAKGGVEIAGEVEEADGELHIYPYKMTQGKVEVVLASDDGVPKWAGGSVRKSGRGHGRTGHHGCGNCGRCRN